MIHDNKPIPIKELGLWRSILGMLCFGTVVIVFCASLLTVVPVPHSALWLPSIIVSEWGHLLAAAPALLLLARRYVLRSRLALFLVVCALFLFLSPLIRAAYTGKELPQLVRESFGRVVPRSLPGAPARPDVIVVADLFNNSVSEVTPDTRIFKSGLTLDLYRRKDLQDALPIVVVVHGGSWQFGDSRQIPAVNHYLAHRGYAVAAVNYRKAPEYPFPAARDDVMDAINYLKVNAGELNLDANRIVLLGRSAGGQLVLVVAYDGRDPAIRGVVSLYAPTDLVWSWKNPGNPLVIKAHKLLREYLAGTPDEKLNAYQRASPLQLAHPDAPPTLLIHGNRDEMIWLRQSERLADRLAQFQVKHLFIRLDWAEHGFDANLWGPGGQIYLYALERFLAAVM